MIQGDLLAESLRTGAVVGVPLSIIEIRRVSITEPGEKQPSIWTHLVFEAADDVAEPLATALATSLSPEGGWYCDFHTETEKFVVFAGKVFRYRRDDEAGHAAAADYGRSVGVPEPQLDWAR